MLPSHTSEITVLIAGAGPCGLILALTLSQNNIPVRIIEKDAKFHVGQRGSGVQPRSLELYNFLGILPDFMARSIWNKPRAIYKMPEGKEVETVVDMTPYIEPTPDVPFSTPRILGQALNEGLLREHLKKHDVHVELATELVSFTQDNDGLTAELLHCDQSGQKTAETVRVLYLVSAEGARSVARKQLGLTFLGETIDSTRIALADVYLKGLSTEFWHQWGDFGTKIVMIRPTEQAGLFSVIAGGADANVDALSGTLEALLAFIVEVTKQDHLEFGEIIWQSQYRPNIRMVNKFSEGRVFLVGDAAHVHSPSGGQGLNTGVQDSFNLAWKLALVLKYNAPSALLETYNEERLLVVKDMLLKTTALFQKTISYKAGSVDTSFAERPKDFRQLAPKNGDEAGVTASYLPENPSTLRAGDRAPDSPGLRVLKGDPAVTSLFAIYKPTRHTVLIFSTNKDVLRAALTALKTAPAGSLQTVLVLPKDCAEDDIAPLRALDADMILIDGQGYAHVFHPPVNQGFTTIVVRPDAVVGAVLKPTTSLDNYLKGVFGDRMQDQIM